MKTEQRIMAVDSNANFYHVENNIYVVRTQAGFEQALKHWFHVYAGKGDRQVGYPESYPALISIRQDYNGLITTVITTLHLNVLRAIIAKDDERNEHEHEQKL